MAEPNSTSQSLASAFSGISFTLKATPAVPMPSFVSWPIVPLHVRPVTFEVERRPRAVGHEIERHDNATRIGRRHELRGGRIRNRDRAQARDT